MLLLLVETEEQKREEADLPDLQKLEEVLLPEGQKREAAVLQEDQKLEQEDHLREEVVVLEVIQADLPEVVAQEVHQEVHQEVVVQVEVLHDLLARAAADLLVEKKEETKKYTIHNE